MKKAATGLSRRRFGLPSRIHSRISPSSRASSGKSAPAPGRDVALQRARVRRVEAALRPVAGEAAEASGGVPPVGDGVRNGVEVGDGLHVGDELIDLDGRQPAAPGGHARGRGSGLAVRAPRAGAAASRRGSTRGSRPRSSRSPSRRRARTRARCRCPRAPSGSARRPAGPWQDRGSPLGGEARAPLDRADVVRPPPGHAAPAAAAERGEPRDERGRRGASTWRSANDRSVEGDAVAVRAVGARLLRHALVRRDRGDLRRE